MNLDGRTRSSAAISVLAAVLALVSLLHSSSATHGQTTPTQQPIGGLRPNLPTVPRQNPRPSQGPGPEERWQVERPADEAAPTASFVDSLKGNDSAFHVVVDQGRLLTTRAPIASVNGTALIAIGDQTIIEFEVLPNPRMIRVIGLRAGVTDLSITTTDGQVYNFEVHVGWDLELLQAHLRQVFPDARLKLGQIREHVVVEGEARSPDQVNQILQTIEAYLLSVQPRKRIGRPEAIPGGGELPPPRPTRRGDEEGAEAEPPDAGVAAEEQIRRPDVDVQFPAAQIINLIRVPGAQQVMLQVRIGELNRTGFREIAADFLYSDERGTTIGTQIGGNGLVTQDGFILGLAVGADATLFSVFPTADLETVIRALRRNSVLNLLAEPNLVAMSGHQASFLAGGEFPVPIPQGGGGNIDTFTVEFKNFGVQLNFVPYVLDDETIRLHVAPEVSSVDFSLGISLTTGGDPIPGLNTRRAETTVELKQGQTLAIAGLLQVDLDAETNRIPGLGDLPYIGPLFSRTSHERIEKELIVLVTPHLVSPMNEDQVPPLPGSEVQDPNDLEFYLLNRIEGRTGQNFRSATAWDDPWHLVERMKLECRHINGAVGHSE
jgi:pilus assembly protein CpaC